MKDYLDEKKLKEELDKLREKYPKDNEKYYYEQAIIFFNWKKIYKAKEAIINAHKLDCDTSWIRLLRARIEEELGNYNEANKSYDNALLYCCSPEEKANVLMCRGIFYAASLNDRKA